jgi:hypothetical protein
MPSKKQRRKRAVCKLAPVPAPTASAPDPESDDEGYVLVQRADETPPANSEGLGPY